MQTGKQATLAEKQALADKLKNGGYAVPEKKPVVEAEPEPVKPPSPPPSESYISEPRSLTNNYHTITAGPRKSLSVHSKSFVSKDSD